MKTRFLFPAVVLGFLAAPLFAADAKYLAPGQPDAIALLAPPIPADSVEGKYALEAVFAAHTQAAPDALARAASENTLTIFHFAPCIGPWFRQGKFPRTEALFKQVEAESKKASDEAKKVFRHPRPYHVAPERFPKAIEHEDPSHYSYPSGHSTRGTVFAALLAELFPEKREALLAKGRDTGWLRVVGAVHYPEDIFAGRVLGQALVRELQRSEKFRADLAAVRVELAAAPHGS